MIMFEGLSVEYDAAVRPALQDIDFTIEEGSLTLVIGATGSGKTTLLRSINGLVPHFTGGTVGGRVLTSGRDTRTHRPRDFADVVGVVSQSPQAGFVTDIVCDELAYGMESLGVAPPVMRRRVEETLDLLGLAELRDRPLLHLSAGERQRVAIGAALTSHPRILVLDEPTSALDPGAAEEVLASLQRLVHDLAITVVMSEHRLERVIQYADAVVTLIDGHGTIADPGTAMRTGQIAPPVVELGRLLGWSPLPLSVRDARRHARTSPTMRPLPEHVPNRGQSNVARWSSVDVTFGSTPALLELDLELAVGETVALMGRNGAGKTTLLQTAVGLVVPKRGTVKVAGINPADLRPRDLLRRVGFVPSDPGDLLVANTVTMECAHSDRDSELAAGTTATLLARIAPDVDGNAHPRDLSEGQRLAVALALVLAPEPSVVLLDEPTRGLDYAAKQRLIAVVRGLEATSLLIATHDVELASEIADRVVVLAGGRIVTDGPTVEVVTASPMFAPQVAKVLAPQRFITVAEVSRSLASTG